MSDKIFFKDVPVGEMFEAYGDLHGNYNYPKIMLLKKEDDNCAMEIENNKEIQRFMFSDSDEVFKIESINK